MTGSPLLYGHSPSPGVVAVRQLDESHVRIYSRRAGAGAGKKAGDLHEVVESRDVRFYPFFHLSDSTLLKGSRHERWLKELEGSGHYRFLCAFDSWSGMWDAVHHVIERYQARSPGADVQSYADVPAILLRTDPVTQFLIQSGLTLFSDMEFGGLKRLQLDIETYSSAPPQFSSADRSGDIITIISLTDNRGLRTALDAHKLTEPGMLRELLRIVREGDYDVIEGHNIFNFDLPYLLKRFDLHGIEPALGRDGTPVKWDPGRRMRSERAMELSIMEVPGRHVIDTWLLLQAYDFSARKLESYGLKSAAQHFGIAKPDRVYLAGNRLSWYWDHDRETLIRYSLDDVDETRQLAEILAPPYFYMARMVPMNYEAVAKTGSVQKIENLLLREYVRARTSVPSPEPTQPSRGGYAAVYRTGILEPVVEVDVESLYPSIMVRMGIAPKSDSLGVFLRLLGELTATRLRAKKEMQAAKDPAERSRLDAVQSSFKILINSFYGYLGYGRGLFNDSIAADKVTSTGQDLLKGLIEVIRTAGGKVIEVDTDGIFFVPPESPAARAKRPRGGRPAGADEARDREFARELGGSLPEGITLAMRGRHAAMLSYKAKNYALLGYDGSVTIKGSSLTSRSVEKFGRAFVKGCIEAILKREFQKVHELYVNLHQAIMGRALPVSEFARTETLRATKDEYRRSIDSEKRNKSAAYETAIAIDMKWRPGDRFTYYIAGSEAGGAQYKRGKPAEDWDPVAPDEDTSYYIGRLDELAGRFSAFFKPADFQRIFSPEDLFGFSAEGISVVNETIEPSAPDQSAGLAQDDNPPDPTILLAEE